MKLYIPKRDISSAGFHLAGIIPVSKDAFDFNHQWPDCLTPIGDNCSLVRYSIYKALCMGCSSIWLAMEREGYSLVRKDIGEYAKSEMKGWVQEERKYIRQKIPIYHYFRRNPSTKKHAYASLITKTMEVARRVSGKFSSHLVPDRFYVSFPGSIVDLNEIKNYRKNFSKGMATIPKTLFQYNDKTVLDGELLDFVCEAEDQNNFDERLVDENLGFIRKSVADKNKREVGPIFEEFIENEDTNRKNLNKNHIITDWDSYRGFFRSNIDLNLPDWELISGEFKYRDLYYEDKS